MIKKNLFFAFCLIILSGVCFAEDNTGQSTLPKLPQTTARVSMDFRDASLKEVLKILSQQSGINFIPSEDVQEKSITLYLENVPIKDAIDTIIKANSLTYEQGPDPTIFIVRPSGEAKVKTTTKIYTLSFAQVAPLEIAQGASPGSSMSASMTGTAAGAPMTGIADIVSKLLTKAGNIVIDQRTNSLVITDIPEQFPIIEEMLVKLDTPTPQVFIEAEIIETSMEATDRIGLEYGGDNGSWSATYAGTAKSFSFPFKSGSFKEHGASSTFTFGTMTLGDLSMTLNMLKSHADTKYLARPKLLTLNNEPAVIDITSETFVGSVTTAQPQTQTSTTSAERMTTGVSLKVTPQVNAADFVTMVLEPSVARTETSGVNTAFLNPIKRSAKAKVMVKDGETIYIGGLLDTQKSGTKRGVPFLSDIPLAGALFKSNSETEKQTEILIFITPHIVRNKINTNIKSLAGISGVPAVTPGLPASAAAPREMSRNQMIDDAVQELERAGVYQKEY